MILTDRDIEAMCNNRARFVKGKALTANRGVVVLIDLEGYDSAREYAADTPEDGDLLTDIDRLEENNIDIKIVAGKVKGSLKEPYNVSLIITGEPYKNDKKFLRAQCNCADFIAGTPFCKHCVALAHHIIVERLNKELVGKLVSASELKQNQSKLSRGMQIAKNAQTDIVDNSTGHVFSNPVKSSAFSMGAKSSTAISRLLSGYSGVSRASVNADGIEKSGFVGDSNLAAERVTEGSVVKAGSIHLIPKLVSDYSGKQYEVEFAIGNADRDYVVKDLSEFAIRVKRGQYFSYGKFLSFVHNIEVFDEDAKYYINVIRDILNVREKLDKTGYNVGRIVKSLPLPEVYLEEVIARQAKKGIKIDDYTYELTEGNPEFALEMEMSDRERGMYIKVPEFVLIEGMDNAYVGDVTARRLYKVSNGFKRKCIPFLTAMLETDFNNSKWNYLTDSTRNMGHFLSEADYVNFCGHVVRRIDRYISIDKDVFNYEEYMPDNCQIDIYLDVDDEDDKKVTCNMKANYGEESYNLSDWSARNKGDFRDTVLEQNAYFAAKRYFTEETRSGEDYLLYTEDEDKIYELLAGGISELREHGQVYVSDRIKGIKVKESLKVTAGVRISGDLLKLSMDIPDMSNEEVSEILSAYKLKRKFYRLKNGDFVKLENGALGSVYEMSAGLDISEKDWKKGEVSLPLYRASFIDAVAKDKDSHIEINRSSDFKSIIRGMKEVEDSDFEVPQSINATLRGYQKTGYRWLRTLAKYGFGGLLADDMGLGKTLQIITLLQGTFDEESYDREENISLIVCPASLVYNWESEINRFAPDMRARVIVGKKDERLELLRELGKVDVIITSYDLLKRDIDSYKAMNFSYMVIDEAQYIKNAGTMVAKAVKSVPASRRYALTGTPVENRLSDLWSIFDFLMKGYLFSHKKFTEKYERPIILDQDEDTLKRLQKLTSPFILRRKKSEVLKDLPDKLEQVVYTTMTEEQQKLYNARFINLKRRLAGISDTEYKNGQIEILSEITRLRQLCCDPELFMDEYKGGSGKVDAAVNMLEELTANGSSVLLFSQFATMLESLRRKLDELNVNNMLLTGHTSKEDRRRMVAEFQSSEKPTVFLISLKAGGTGLNLTAADTVIHFDPWWNVAVQNQATDRAHRIGQQQVVTVIQLVMKHSIEERIIELQEKKKALASDVIEGSGVSAQALTKEEVMGLLELRDMED